MQIMFEQIEQDALQARSEALVADGWKFNFMTPSQNQADFTHPIWMTVWTK